MRCCFVKTLNHPAGLMVHAFEPQQGFSERFQPTRIDHRFARETEKPVQIIYRDTDRTVMRFGRIHAGY